jgi:undecaprenyl-diphosphatase
MSAPLYLFIFAGLETLENLDRHLFLFLNGKHNSLFDLVFWYSSLTVTWIPLYAFLLFLVIKKFGKLSWLPLLSVALIILSTDRGSVLVKNNVQRYRPSHNLEILEEVHTLRADKGGQFGFVSSHAANTFGLALFLVLILKPKKKYFSFLLLFWAAFVSYGRIYGGLHYPSDIFFGGILGMCFAFLIFKIQNFVLNKYFNSAAETIKN